MALPQPVPLYPTYQELKHLSLNDYPQMCAEIEGFDEWQRVHWNWGKDYLLYIGRNKSEHTYTRFRNEIERFLLWAILIKNQAIDIYRKSDILDYADFCWHPPVQWIATQNHDRFIFENGYFKSNEAWRPFKLQAAKSAVDKKVDKKRYRPSQQTLTSTFTAIISFFNYLMGEELVLGNPAQIAKKDCKHFITESQIKEPKRLTEDQWQYVLDTATTMADENPLFERNLFIIAATKVLFLRISELSERPNWSPEMGHFWQDSDHNWWLRIFGKGRKIRDVTVPLAFLHYLKRYRTSRGLTALPDSGENTVLVEKIRGQGGMTARHLRRLVQQVFDQAFERMSQSVSPAQARKLKEATTHWLRHTGASMEVERGRALKDLSEDLGHASMATTDTVYVQTENKKRAESGKTRRVD
ncbi:tyrosine-type recombinase/integrase [Marinicella sp. S1101]|uniref:tyrosine-type recombinase/integrase n=1 Tax=Marinicella marina TaxID=2996016 RepID=UPI002260E007|nr:tyrosine-type recombinase/integrase [Marinicella marina]MCX7553389.1 tyrosine-type recombinase/integrase [Marinicella marina]